MIVIWDTKDYGKSIFANQKISSWETVLIISGSISKTPSEYTIPISLDSYIDPANEAKYLCHSCSPNCWIRNNREVVAIMEIETWAEITIDYAMIVARFHEDLPGGKVVCSCGSSNCRGKFIGFLDLDSLTQSRYRKWTSEYIKTLI